MSEQAQEQAGGQSAEGALGKLDQIMAALSDARVSDAAPCSTSLAVISRSRAMPRSISCASADGSPVSGSAAAAH